jgi:transposase
VIQVQAVDAAGRVVTNRALPRDKFVAWRAQLPPGCMVAMEVSFSAHPWGRKLIAMGLDARIVSAQLLHARPGSRREPPQGPHRTAQISRFDRRPWK